MAGVGVFVAGMDAVVAVEGVKVGEDDQSGNAQGGGGQNGNEHFGESGVGD